MNLINNKYRNVITIILIGLCTGCEREVDLKIPGHESLLVVEGWIEQDRTPRVLLSLSAPYFIKIDSSNLRQYSVTTAKVTVFSNSESDILTLKPNDVYFPPYFYFGTSFTGIEDNTYDIEIVFRGETYTATTTIPNIVSPDSVWFEKEESSDTLGLIWFEIVDNGNENNYYRTLTKRIGKDRRYIPTFNSVFSDETFNGDTLRLFASRGSASLLDLGENHYFDVGDTIVFKLCSIDKESYEFWNSLQKQIISSANPFTVSNEKVQTNIEGGLGIWYGCAASYDTVVAR